MKFCLLACSLVLAGCGVSEPVGVLRACLGEDDLPRSHAGSRSGFDVDVAQFLAEELNHSLEIVWLEADVPTEIESLIARQLDDKD